MSFVGAHEQRNAATAGAVVLFHGAVLFFLLAQSTVEVAPAAEALKLFEVHEVPPAPVPEKAPEKRAPKPEGAASKPNLRAKPKPVVAPPPVVRVEAPPVVAPPVAALGPDVSAGAGAGLGSGLGGSGTGGGGGTRPRWLSGRIKDSDYPRMASAAEIGGTVVVHFDVGTDGRVSNCRVAESSGNAALDATTCRLIEKRFRYEPARDGRGEPVADVAGWRQDWWLEPPR